ncbi:hypothetical protein Acr_18g0006000 [Actinidia rufa]|uniref:Reverse transcriptase Ty1/copia-type domain-containing protein n=1 Tax=Actinidia rufa TaxID=165716 RepID=A0A7J0G6L5_9ERIC|nr:hypothetical protein Acr_18g0006000 [Actinidia rufa]
MDEKIKSLHKNQTWELVQLPKGKKAIGCKSVFAKKKDTPGIRFKARLFVLKLAQLDVKIAFLHGDLDEEICMAQPDGFKVPDKEHLAYWLKKSLYGLKQSPRQCFMIYLLLYVDDMLIASKSKVEIDILKAQLSQEFEMKDLGKAKKILKIEIKRDKVKGTVWLTKTQYLKKVLQKFSMNSLVKSVCTSLAFHFKLNASMSPRTDDERKYMANIPYANVVGALMYASMVNRDDKSSQYLVGYVDFDYAGDLDK